MQWRHTFGAEADRRLETHLTMVNESADRLGASSSGDGCTPPTTPATFNYNDKARFADVARLQIHLVSAAFACELARIATLQF